VLVVLVVEVVVTWNETTANAKPADARTADALHANAHSKKFDYPKTPY